MSEPLTTALVEMREDDVLAAVRVAKEAGAARADIIADLQAGMKEIGDKYEAEDSTTSPSSIMSAEIFKRALEELGLDRSAADTGTRGTVDTRHRAHRHPRHRQERRRERAQRQRVQRRRPRRRRPSQQFVDAVRDSGAQVVGLSCLLTTAFPAMQETIDALAAAGLRDDVSVIIGGGPVSGDLAAQLGADGAGASAQEAVNLAAKAIEGGAA